MNYFERVMKGRLFFSSEKLPEQVVKFIFMNESYILEEFRIGFSQEINQKGRPDGLPVGGIIYLTFTGAPDYYINEWMLRENLLRNGEIRFLSGDFKVTSGAELIILFEDAYCVEYKKHIHTLKGGLFTSLTISPRSVKIRNEEFTNRWKQEEQLPYYIRSGKTE
ncbi:MAG: hypothetical protein LBB84_05380 [Tannerellaceae bacterium]|jgi:hypothetical protein|nr:hypothetical protein [Tannerellaceae bacterium]